MSEELVVASPYGGQKRMNSGKNDEERAGSSPFILCSGEKW